MSPTNWAVLLLVISSALAIAGMVVIHRRGRDGMRLRLIMLVNFFIAHQLSGLAHVLGWSKSRGFYEAMAGSPPGSTTGLVPAAVATLVGTVALMVGLWGRPREVPAPKRPQAGDSQPWAERNRLLVLAIGCAMTVVSLWALTKVLAATAGAGSERIIAVSGGNARYVFLADWMPWGLTTVAVGLFNPRRTPLAEIGNAAVLLSVCAAIAASQAWSGGRSSVLFYCVPVLALYLPRMGITRWLAVSLGAVALSIYVWYQTVARAGTGEPFDLWGLADWQWGRFSMAAWAFKYVGLHGVTHGESYLSGLFVVPASLMHFVGVDLQLPWKPIVALTGQYFRGSEEMNFIVPGSMAELVIGFGWAGVVLGYLVFGWASRLLADAYRHLDRVFAKLLVAALAVQVMSQMVMQFEALFQGVIMGMLPVWGLALLEWWSSRGRPSQTALTRADSEI